MNSLVDDIFSLYSDGEGVPTRRRMVSASDGLASLCERYAWYEANSPIPRKIDTYLRRRFMYGKLHEDTMVSEISRLEARGWRMKGFQLRVSMWGIKGVIDLLVRDPEGRWWMLEIKTMNPEDFKKLKAMGLDAFPRIKEQSMFYLGAMQEIPFREKDRVVGGIVLAENTFPLGELIAVEFELDQELLRAMSTKIDEVREIIALSQPPPRPFTQDSKHCTYCFRRKQCWGTMPTPGFKTHHELTDPQTFARLLTAHLKTGKAVSESKDQHDDATRDMRNFLEQEKVTDIHADFGNGVSFTVTLSETQVKEYKVDAHSYIRLDVR